ncbi:MAG: hypothetical protein KF774_07940 [Planctomyces sp.]|nr:hypothetical protein [Planctomyces sp.]
MSRRSKRRRNPLRDWAPQILTAIAVCGIAVGGFLLVQKLRSTGGGEGAGGGGLMASLGLAPSAAGMLEELADGMDDVHQELVGVQDAAGRDRAFARIQQRGRELEQLYQKLPSVEMVEKSELDAAAKAVDARLSPTRLTAEIQRIHGIGAGSVDLEFLIEELSGIVRQLKNTIVKVGQIPPAPQGEHEQIEYDFLMTKRDAVLALAKFAGSGDAAPALAALQASYRRVVELQDVKWELPRLQSAMAMAGLKYQSVAAGYDEMARVLLGMRASRNGGESLPPELEKAYSDFSTAEANFRTATQAGSVRMSQLGAPNGTPNGSPDESPAPGPANRSPAGPVGQFGPPGGSGPVFGGRAGPPGARGSGRSPTGFDAANGLTIWIRGEAFEAASPDLTDMERRDHRARRGRYMSDIKARVRELTGASSVGSHEGPMGLRVEANYTGDVQAIADAMEFAEVTQVDPTSREITIEYANVD